MNKQLKRGLLAGVLGMAGLLLLTQSDASAALSGRCDNCHTMHNSQAGTYMTTGTGGAAQGYLLRSTSCLGCHTGDAGDQVNAATSAPAVQHTGNPGNQYLAGGTFYYFTGGNDQFIHNVDEVDADASDALITPNLGAMVPPGNGAVAMANTFSCASGTSAQQAYLTTGCHLGAGHHSNVGGDNASPTEVVFVDGSSIGASYRFLSGLGANTFVKGGEVGDWEWAANARVHNVYFAEEAYNDSATNTITALCKNCHGDFHGANHLGTSGGGTAAASPWIRHPTDISLYDATGPDAAEHLSYGSYNPTVPLASHQVDADYTNDTTISVADMTTKYNVLNDANMDVVTCVTCHRAHGTQFADMLRWSYATQIAGGGASTGCLTCHSNKQ